MNPLNLFNAMSALEKSLIVFALLLCALFAFGWHERTVQGAKDTAAYTKNAKSQLDSLQKQLDAARKSANAEQAKVDAYNADHDLQPIRLCYNRVVPQSQAAAGAAPADTGPAVVPPVLGPVAGPNISDGVAVILSASERLAVLERQRQQK